ncbi:hypothetical protein QFZ64_003549 [Streptomyces sp. B3I8]|nr:hypothetical protein [Streptomyces sp. B3I8]
MEKPPFAGENTLPPVGFPWTTVSTACGLPLCPQPVDILRPRIHRVLTCGDPLRAGSPVDTVGTTSRSPGCGRKKPAQSVEEGRNPRPNSNTGGAAGGVGASTGGASGRGRGGAVGRVKGGGAVPRGGGSVWPGCGALLQGARAAEPPPPGVQGAEPPRGRPVTGLGTKPLTSAGVRGAQHPAGSPARGPRGGAPGGREGEGRRGRITSPDQDRTPRATGAEGGRPREPAVPGAPPPAAVSQRQSPFLIRLVSSVTWL